MSEWLEMTLDTVATINPEPVPKDWTAEQDIQYVDIASVSCESGINLDSLVPIAFGNAPGRARRRIRSHDVLVSTVRPNLRAFAVVPHSLDGQVASTGFAVVRPGSDVAQGFVWCVVRSDAFVDEMVNRCTGSNYPAIRGDDVASYPFLLPPPAEQRRIVAVISALDAQIMALEATSRRTEQLRTSLITTVVNGSAEECTLSDYAVVSQGRSLPKSVQGTRTGNLSWFKIADMTSPPNMFGYTEGATRLTREEIKSLGGLVLPRNSVVFPRVGAAVLTEKKRILDVDAAVDENHLVLTPKASTDAEFLLGLMEQFRLADLVQTGAVPSLNMGLIRAARVARVDRDTQQTMGRALLGLRQLIRAQVSELAAVRRFRTDILNALLSQELTADEAVDQFIAEGVA